MYSRKAADMRRTRTSVKESAGTVAPLKAMNKTKQTFIKTYLVNLLSCDLQISN